MWFYPTSMNQIPRRHRAETLQLMFSDGFENFNSLMKYANLSKRIVGWNIRIFVHHPSLRWAVELFFRFYYTACEMRKREKRSFRTPVGAEGPSMR